MKRHFFFYVVVLSTILQWHSIYAESKGNTNIEDISNQSWYYENGFKEEFKKYSLNDIKKHQWKNIKKLPARAHRLFNLNKKPDELIHFSLFTTFETPQKQNLNEPVALYFPLIGKNWAIYVNGQLIKKEVYLSEKSKIMKSRTVRFLIVPFDQSILNENENNLLIEIYGPYAYEFTGIPFSGVEFGNYFDIEGEHIEFYELALITLYLFTGLYHLLLFIRRRKEKYNLYFAIFTILLFIYLFSRSTIVFSLLSNLNTDIITKIEIVSLFILIPFFVLFLEDLYSKRITLISKGYLAISIVFSIIAAIVSLLHIRFILVLWQITALASAIYLIIITVKAIRKNITEAKSLAVAIVILISLAVFDIIDSIFMQTHMNLAKYGFFLFIIGIATILANRFLRVHNEVEFLNENLELQVEEKTKELRETFENVKKLKEKQDGDYYLTSLLIKPLNRSLSTSKNLEVESFTLQKKKFTFKKKKEVEIGGDINISDTITLKNRLFTAFLNADAMGKSIQGAGGALVIGVEFHSYLNRTKLSRAFQDKFPENWLKNIFYDLHNMFETFDGSMLASIIVGLIDHETGFTYYINAEHPWSCLYRDGKAGFLEETLYLHKLGIPFNRNLPVMIHTIQLRENDILFFGSDGRDDILLGYDEKGSRILNEDENLFLKHIEKSSGDMEKLVNSIQSSGDLTDDLSILKVLYKKNDFYPEKAEFITDENIMNDLSRQIENIYKESINDTGFLDRKDQYTLLNRDQTTDLNQKIKPVIEHFFTDTDLFYENQASREIIRYFNQNGHDIFALITMELFNESYPHNIERIEDMVHAYKNAGLLKAALLHAERLRCRIPFDMNNLLSLIEIYHSMQDVEKATEHANCLLKHYPSARQDNARAEAILNQLN